MNSIQAEVTFELKKFFEAYKTISIFKRNSLSFVVIELKSE